MDLGLSSKFENEKLCENTEMLKVTSAPQANRDANFLWPSP